MVIKKIQILVRMQKKNSCYTYLVQMLNDIVTVGVIMEVSKKERKERSTIRTIISTSYTTSKYILNGIKVIIQ